MAIQTFDPRFGAFLAGTALALGLAASAQAAPTTDVPAITVRFRALDLNSEAGAKMVYQRIVRAAQRVCPGDGTLGLDRRARSMQCRNEAIARAVSAINNERLAAVYVASNRQG